MSSANIALVVLLIVMAGIVYFILSVRKRHIISFDDAGVKTRDGKEYSWANLKETEYYIRSGPGEKVHSIHFHFPDGKASAGYMMPILAKILPFAAGLKAPVRKKIVAAKG